MIKQPVVVCEAEHQGAGFEPCPYTFSGSEIQIVLCSLDDDNATRKQTRLQHICVIVVSEVYKTM